MSRLFFKRIALLVVATALLIGGGWVWLRKASAQACPGNKQHGVSVNGGPVVTANTQGGIDVLPVGTGTTTDGRKFTKLEIADVFSRGNVEGLGDLVISLDTSRQAPPSTLVANRAGADFPATQTMQFYPTFTLNGEAFIAQQPARVVNSNVTSFPPKAGTVYVLTNAMTLKSEQGNTMTLEPGKAFTVGAGAV
jgi:hypothetical protein